MSGAPVLLGVGVGVLTGLHAATWGAYKDTPFEGFRWHAVARSIAFGAAAGLLVGWLERQEALLVLVGLIYACERLATEWWKAFLREDRKSSYAIPMRFAVGGRPVDGRLPRYAAGAVVLVGLVLSGVVLRPLGWHGSPGAGTVLVGGVGGWLTAVGGAWKDAPIEGFSAWKFMRSPVVATLWSLVLARLVSDWWVLAVAAGGLSVLVIETYKTFLTGDRPPGKFAGLPERFRQGRVRRHCRRLHCLVYGALGGVVVGSAAVVVPVTAAVALAMLVTARRPGQSRIASASLRVFDGRMTDSALSRSGR
jgi:hypothetical protein